MGRVDTLKTYATGQVQKAYLLVRKEIITQEDMKKQAGSNTDLLSMLSKELDPVSMINNLNSTLQDNMDAISENATLLGVNTMIANGANKQGFIPIRVQYNPSSITFSGLKGFQGFDNGHDGTYMDYKRPIETTMGIELIFDTMDISKAFMMDKTAKDVALGVFQKSKSVRPIVELLIGATVFPSTRWVGFAWNKTLFWGELVNVSATYSMFDMEGEPVRAKVAIKIRQDEVHITDLAKNGEGEMIDNRKKVAKEAEAQFKALGKKKPKMSSTVSNMINTNY